MLVRRDPRPPPVAAWRFVSNGRSATSPVEEAGFRAGLHSALRAAHGAGTRVGLTLASGPEPSLVLDTDDPRSARWAGRTLLPAYGPERWVEEPTGSLDTAGSGSLPLHGRRVFDWPEPLGSGGAPGSILDEFARALVSVGPGVTLRWEWSPLFPPRSRWWSSPPPLVVPPPPAFRTGPRTIRPPLHEPAVGQTERPLCGRLRLILAEPAPTRPGRRAGGASAALEAAARTPRGNGVRFVRTPSLRGILPARPPRLLVTLEEWAAFWPSRTCPASAERRPVGELPPLLPLGRTASGSVVGPSIEPNQGRHLAVLGETGMGKSSLLVALGRRVFGEAGGVVFDPLGDTAAALRAALPEGARARVVWVSPTGPSPAVNALEGIGYGEDLDLHRSERRLNDLVHALRRVRSGRYEESSYWGPRLEEMVTRALRAAAAFPRGTIEDAHTLLATSARLGRPIPPSATAPLRELSDRIRERPEDADGARRLLHEVVRSPVLVRMLCDPEPRWRVRDLVTAGRIVLVSGEAATVGEATARYLLSVYLALVWSELLAREGSAKTFVLLDEAQWFSHESLAEMLRLGRRRNVHVVLATQAIASLSPAVGEAVWTNVSDFVAFRGSPEEAREFARASSSLGAEEILALPRGRAAVLLGKGHRIHWVRSARLPESLLSRRDGPSAPEVVPAVEPPGGDARDRPPSSGDGGHPRAPASPGAAGPPDPALAVLKELQARLERAPPGEGVTVRLDQLREGCDPTGEGVRRVGSVLGRLGLCDRSTTPEGGSAWTIDERARGYLRAACGAEVRDASAAPQPS